MPWWTTELTILRKRVLALRRRFQLTRNNENLRLERKLQYQEGNRTYQNNLQQAKLESWKLFCSQTNENNPWNVAYKIAAGKLHNKTHLTTLQISVEEYTTDTSNAINHMLEHFVPEDLVTDDSEHHKAIRKHMTEPIDTEDDVQFTLEEVITVLRRFDSKKFPVEDCLNSDILFRTFKFFPKFFTQIYNECLRRGYFPKQWSGQS